MSNEAHAPSDRRLPRRPGATRRVAAILAGLAALCGAGIAAEEPAENDEIRVAPRPVKVVSPVHPPELKEQKITGDVEIVAVITEKGEVTEAKVVAASRPEFGDSALVAVKQWSFEPGTVDGVPTAMRVNIPFNFRALTPLQEELTAYAERELYLEITEEIVPAEQMPSWPMPKALAEPRYPPDLVGSGKRGKAVVSVVIDKEGRVVNPKLVKTTFPEFGPPAIAAAISMQFPPQVKSGKDPVYVSMDVQFDFRDDGKNAKPKREEPRK